MALRELPEEAGSRDRRSLRVERSAGTVLRKASAWTKASRRVLAADTGTRRGGLPWARRAFCRSRGTQKPIYLVVNADGRAELQGQGIMLRVPLFHRGRLIAGTTRVETRVKLLPRRVPGRARSSRGARGGPPSGYVGRRDRIRMEPCGGSPRGTAPTSVARRPGCSVLEGAGPAGRSRRYRPAQALTPTRLINNVETSPRCPDLEIGGRPKRASDVGTRQATRLLALRQRRQRGNFELELGRRSAS